jgi:hypothetical protein
MITAMVTGTGTVAFAEGRRWQHQGGGNCQDERCLAKQRHATARKVARDVSIALGGELFDGGVERVHRLSVSQEEAPHDGGAYS